MPSKIVELFSDTVLVNKIKKRLPYLFQLAELESSRAGITGMQAGSLRETIITALLIYKFGETNVQTDIAITEPEVDVRVFGEPVSVKTKSKTGLTGVKLSWTVDTAKAEEFSKSYRPSCHILFIHVIWDGLGGFYFIPLEIQEKVFDKLGAQRYIKLPKPGTNPRGVEITKEALTSLTTNESTKVIEIEWLKTKVDYNPYKRWVDYWKEG